MISQLGGLGLAAYGMFGNPGGQTLGKAEGGTIKEADSPAGLSELLLYDMEKA
jgi:hypothetical protein